MNIFKSKTFWGAVLMAAAKIYSDPTPISIVESLGGVIAAAGVRHAIAKGPDPVLAAQQQAKAANSMTNGAGQ